MGCMCSDVAGGGVLGAGGRVLQAASASSGNNHAARAIWRRVWAASMIDRGNGMNKQGTSAADSWNGYRQR